MTVFVSRSCLRTPKVTLFWRHSLSSNMLVEFVIDVRGSEQSYMIHCHREAYCTFTRSAFCTLSPDLVLYLHARLSIDLSVFKVWSTVDWRFVHLGSCRLFANSVRLFCAWLCSCILRLCPADERKAQLRIQFWLDRHPPCCSASPSARVAFGHPLEI